MSAQRKTQGGGGALLLVVVAAALLWSPSKARMPRTVKPVKVAAPVENTKYQVLRFYGAKVQPSRVILEQEAEKAARKQGIDHRIFKALVRVESSWNPKARSRAGAISLSQIMPANAKRCGLKSSKELWDPIKNLHCGAQILREELDTYGGNVTMALQSYNGGPFCLNKCPESIQHASKVLALVGRG